MHDTNPKTVLPQNFKKLLRGFINIEWGLSQTKTNEW